MKTVQMAIIASLSSAVALTLAACGATPEDALGDDRDYGTEETQEHHQGAKAKQPSQSTNDKEPGQKCKTDTDCASGVCTQQLNGKRCTPAVQLDECRTNTDCASGVCTQQLNGKRCAPTVQLDECRANTDCPIGLCQQTESGKKCIATVELAETDLRSCMSDSKTKYGDGLAKLYCDCKMNAPKHFGAYQDSYHKAFRECPSTNEYCRTAVYACLFKVTYANGTSWDPVDSCIATRNERPDSYDLVLCVKRACAGNDAC